MRTALLLIAAALTGCVASIPTGVIRSDGRLAEYDPNAPVPQGSEEPQLNFSVRVMGGYSASETNMADLLARHSPLENVHASDPSADVQLKWTFTQSPTGVVVDAVSNYNGEVLFRCQDAWWTQESAGKNLGRMLHKAFIPGGALYKKVIAQRPAHAAKP